MSEKKQSKLNRKLYLALFVDKTYEQLWSLHLTPLKAVVAISFAGLVLVVGVTLLIAFTGLREYIPGYPTGEERRMIMANMQRSDSIIEQIAKRDRMIRDLRAVLSGELPDEHLQRDSLALGKAVEVTFKKSDADSVFRLQVEAEDRYNVSSGGGNVADADRQIPYLYPPIKGVVTNKYGETSGHWGVDIVAPEGSQVAAAYSGTVILAEWTLETGFVLILQHSSELISVYKHNNKLLKRVGECVTAGEAISLLGNTGELTTTAHLHFELWRNGVPLNPENYVQFK